METPSSAPIRIALVDDHRSVLWGLEKLIESAAPRMQLVAKATCHDEAINAVNLHRPDVVLVDLDLGGESGVDLIPRLIQSDSKPKAIVLTGTQDMQLRDSAIVAGARGVVHKSEPAETILQAIEHVCRGELWLDRSTVGRIFSTMLSTDRPATQPGNGGTDPLTARERNIINAVVQHRGAPNKVIAEALHISGHTLRNHLSTIYGKLGVNRRLDLVLYAMENGLVSQ
jgi:two-component system, NarL family, nitrate/nitrite response regulator NarL